jgi:hypothetical protein
MPAGAGAIWDFYPSISIILGPNFQLHDVSIPEQAGNSLAYQNYLEDF